MNRQILIFQNFDELSRKAAEKFIEIGSRAIEARSRFTVALAGGSTPKRVYEMLSGEEFRVKIDWKRVFFFFGDERNALPDSEESNFRMAKETFFKPLGIDEKNIFRWQTELADPKQTAENYAADLESVFEGFPAFDLTLLGMGGDGHTASLFPYTKALEETRKTATENHVEALGTMRFTMTFPVINNSRNVMFLIKGSDKAEVLKEVLEGEFQPEKLPSQSVQPGGGDLYWFLDEDAARLLDRRNI